ncbi:SWIM domain containing-Srs2 interacting protein 1 [Schizosaccharomyces cryophilus OY26]|uniref:SWIM domain containing-Srs2 interacting protein 1 n=1 Tax=Schizosaccharomyces cryophilus (strain OY26 / ATCC MYA-4695 / CBS 11777 / NBRC 106824 / NRRL Y48691) TaxID=653667 RepID=S9VMM5_SCHCR|nr:SWIM domain containing-Srs2 interacting protein 1 [Schizosaccharomyces cryophilus OY26]EPY49213.1 SWIM domain containing-Srs2 interacting protein 1 [Schizosaccharomyces cryophilus OY26]
MENETENQYTKDKDQNDLSNKETTPPSLSFQESTEGDFSELNSDTAVRKPFTKIRPILSDLFSTLEENINIAKLDAARESRELHLNELLLSDSSIGDIWLGLSFLFHNTWHSAMALMDSNVLYPMNPSYHLWECTLETGKVIHLNLHVWHCNCPQFTYNAFKNPSTFSQEKYPKKWDRWGGGCVSPHPPYCAHLLAASLYAACRSVPF